MATTQDPPLHRLPNELLLNVARQLRARTSASVLAALRSFCLASKKLHPFAQEELYAGAYLHVSCGCHPAVNATVQLLRTLLRRPDLASKVKDLQFLIARRQIGKLYGEKNYSLFGIRQQCSERLLALGYRDGHPWWTSLVNDIESAYAGVLLTLLSDLETLKLSTWERHRGWPTLEPMTAFFGTSTTPVSVVAALKDIRDLATTDVAFVRDLEFTCLKTIAFTRIDLGTVMRLNGPNTLRGAVQLQELSIGLSIQLLDESFMDGMDVCLRDLYESLGCTTLRTLRITLFNDAYCLGQSPVFCIKYFMSQLEPVLSTLRILDIDLDYNDESTEWEWFLVQCEDPIEFFGKLPLLEHLKIPQEFLFKEFPGGSGIRPADLPQKLQYLSVVAPDHDVIEWVKGFFDSATDLLKLGKNVLHCRMASACKVTSLLLKSMPYS